MPSFNDFMDMNVKNIIKYLDESPVPNLTQHENTEAHRRYDIGGLYIINLLLKMQSIYQIRIQNNASHPTQTQKSLFDLKNDYFDIFRMILTPCESIRECLFHNPDLASITGGSNSLLTELDVIMIISFIDSSLKNVSTVTLHVIKGILLEARFKGVSEEVFQGFFRELKFWMGSRFPEMKYVRILDTVLLGTREDLNGE